MAAHVAACKACSAAVADLRLISTVMQGAAGPVAPSAECLDDGGIARAVDGQASSDELAHITACVACRGRVLAVARAAADPAVASAARTAGRGRANIWRRRALAVGGVAAAAVITLTVARRPADLITAPATHRDVPTAVVAAPAPVSPVDAVVGRPVTLQWSATPGATQYQVTVFDVEGSVLWRGESSGTALVVPDTVALSARETYWWRVEARVGFGRWLQSEIAPFVLQPQTR
jgi:hypothetical protein